MIWCHYFWLDKAGRGRGGGRSTNDKPSKYWWESWITHFSPRAISLKSILIQDQFIEWCLIFLFTMFSKMTVLVWTARRAIWNKLILTDMLGSAVTVLDASCADAVWIWWIIECTKPPFIYQDSKLSCISRSLQAKRPLPVWRHMSLSACRFQDCDQGGT